MTTPENLSELFGWSIWGLDRILRNNGLTKSQKIINLIDDFDKENDPIRAFIEEVAGESEMELKAYFNQKETAMVQVDYQIWCKNNGYKEMNNVNFGKQLKRHIPNLKKDRPRNNFKRIYRYIL